MAISLAQATAKVTLWMAVDDALAKNQSYTIGDRILTRVNADEVTKKLNYWLTIEAQLTRSANGQNRLGYSLANMSKKL